MFVFSPRHLPGAGRPTLTPSSTGQGSLARLSMSPLEYTCIDYPHRVERVRRRHVCFFSPTPAWRGATPHAPPSRRQAQVRGPLPVCRCRHWNILVLTIPIEWRGCVDGMFVFSPRHLARGDPARPTLTPSSTGQGSLARLSMSPLEYTCIDYPHRVERVRRRHVCFFSPTPAWRGATPHAPPSRRQAQVRGPLPVCRCRHWNILALTNPIEWRGCVDGMFVCSPRHLARGDPARPTLTPSSTGQGSLARLSMSPLEYTCID